MSESQTIILRPKPAKPIQLFSEHMQNGNLYSLALGTACGAQAYSKRASLPSVWENATFTPGPLHT